MAERAVNHCIPRPVRPSFRQSVREAVRPTVRPSVRSSVRSSTVVPGVCSSGARMAGWSLTMKEKASKPDLGLISFMLSLHSLCLSLSAAGMTAMPQ